MTRASGTELKVVIATPFYEHRALYAIIDKMPSLALKTGPAQLERRAALCLGDDAKIGADVAVLDQFLRLRQRVAHVDQVEVPDIQAEASLTR